MVARPDDAWQLRAACRGPHADIFFPPARPERKEERAAREEDAKAICATCRVRAACLDYALRIREPHGVWGGLSEIERKQIIERRAAAG